MIDGMLFFFLKKKKDTAPRRRSIDALTLIYSAFGGPDSLKGNTGPFWVGSGE